MGLDSEFAEHEDVEIMLKDKIGIVHDSAVDKRSHYRMAAVEGGAGALLLIEERRNAKWTEMMPG